MRMVIELLGNAYLTNTNPNFQVYWKGDIYNNINITRTCIRCDKNNNEQITYPINSEEYYFLLSCYNIYKDKIKR